MNVRVRRRRRPTAARRRPEEPTGPKTFSIWSFAAVFAVLGLLGLGWLLWGPQPEDGSVELHVPQTLPEETAAPTPPRRRSGSPTTEPTGMAGLIPGTTSPTTSVPSAPATRPTLPNGSPAPEGVTEVVAEGDTVRLRFVGPAGLPQGWAARVAPTVVSPVAGDRGLQLRIGCAASPSERLVEVAITEGDTAITVAVAVVSPPEGPPCADGSDTVLEVPLRGPVAGRTLVAVPPGTDIASALGSG